MFEIADALTREERPARVHHVRKKRPPQVALVSVHNARRDDLNGEEDDGARNEKAGDKEEEHPERERDMEEAEQAGDHLRDGIRRGARPAADEREHGYDRADAETLKNARHDREYHDEDDLRRIRAVRFSVQTYEMHYATCIHKSFRRRAISACAIMDTSCSNVTFAFQPSSFCAFVVSAQSAWTSTGR